MKILLICKKFPFPPKDGESIAILQMSQALAARGCEITLLAMNTTRHPFQMPSNIPADLQHFKSIHMVSVDNRISVWGAFLNIFSKDSYHITRFVSDSFRDKLTHLLKDNTFDLIQLETLYLAPYINTIKSNSKAPVVMRAHNIEHEIWDRISEQIKYIPKKWYLKYLSEKLRKFEIQMLNQYDLLVSITDRDLEIFRALGYKNGCISSPVGIKLEKEAIHLGTAAHPNKVCFIGSLDWIPNLEGLEWFIETVWPNIKEKFPECEFHVAGRNAPDRIVRNHQPGVFYHGEVEDSGMFIEKYPIFIVPLNAGSGLRIKIIEAMSLGRVVITTSMGLEGIPAIDGRDLLIADTAEQFLKAIQLCFENPDKVIEIGQNARNFIESNFDRDRFAGKLVEAYRAVMSGTHHIS